LSEASRKAVTNLSPGFLFKKSQSNQVILFISDIHIYTSTIQTSNIRITIHSTLHLSN